MRAFSLVELSIVLVILGLLTGGILAGQSLIRGAQVRNITVEFNKYTTATHAFREKYMALPGDFKDATKFWTTATYCPGHGGNTTAAGRATCDGDGNGEILYPPTAANETYRFWQHLSDAGLIEGVFTGATGHATQYTRIVDTFDPPNVPVSKFPQAWWNVIFLGTVPVSDPDHFDGSFRNVFRFGGVGGAYAAATGRVLKPEEAWNIDTKIDDGKPGTGFARTVKWQAESTTNNQSCTTPPWSDSVSIAKSSTYYLSNSGINCSLIFDTGY